MRDATGRDPAGLTHSSLHGLGVLCGISAGAWLGAAEAPTKLVETGLSPFAISLCMVAGVFTARWSFPTLLKGTRYVVRDLGERRHLILWAILAGALWAVANTLTVFAVRDVGLAVAFPLWNANSLIGLFWGRVLFNELKGAGRGVQARVVLGAVAIAGAAVMLGFSTLHGAGAAHHRVMQGILAALGASLLWGTMYVPYRKAYLSGMNPLSFVTAFTVGELGTMLALVLALDGGLHAPVFHSPAVRPLLFWLFLGGFVWVVGDLFQQFATKYLGIGRGIPLSNTNQLWGLSWGALVFGELTGAGRNRTLLVIGGSVVMILGALAISSAVAGSRERASTNQALQRECDRYGLDYHRTLIAYLGSDTDTVIHTRDWWDYLILACAVGIFVWLASQAAVPHLRFNHTWLLVLAVLLLLIAAVCFQRLRRLTHFS